MRTKPKFAILKTTLARTKMQVFREKSSVVAASLLIGSIYGCGGGQGQSDQAPKQSLLSDATITRNVGAPDVEHDIKSNGALASSASPPEAPTTESASATSSAA